MANYKRDRLEQLQNLLESNFHSWLANSEEDKSKIIEALQDWYDRARKESDWPLNLPTGASVVFTILLPTLKSVWDLLSQLRK